MAHTEEIFRNDSYRRSCTATIIDVAEDAIILDRTLCYPSGGGQPGDHAVLTKEDGGIIAIIDTVYGSDGAILHKIAAAERVKIQSGDQVRVQIDWDRRYRHMRVHSCLHLLSAILPYPVTGGQIRELEGRLDFDIATPGLDKVALTKQLNDLIAADHAVTMESIDEAELDRNPGLVRTMAVAPPRGRGSVRLIRIADCDLQPCGGTHVQHCGEIGVAAITKIEKKGSRNRRVRIALS